MGLNDKIDYSANEPRFVLLGRDPDAPSLIDSWASAREHIGEDPDKVASARRCAYAMRAWLTLIGKQERRPVNYGPGELQVGIDPERGLVIIELPRDLTGHIGFSPAQAQHLAHLLLRKADEANLKWAIKELEKAKNEAF